VTVSIRQLILRVWYGGKKGRAARKRLRAWANTGPVPCPPYDSFSWEQVRLNRWEAAIERRGVR
jgi:hypothetical protein